MFRNHQSWSSPIHTKVQFLAWAGLSCPDVNRKEDSQIEVFWVVSLYARSPLIASYMFYPECQHFTWWPVTQTKPWNYLASSLSASLPLATYQWSWLYFLQRMLIIWPFLISCCQVLELQIKDHLKELTVGYRSRPSTELSAAMEIFYAFTI